MEINIIDACKQKYGIKTPESWPGTFITNFDQFKNACYGSCARFNNQQSISQVINSECGQQCEQAMLEQIKLNGKNPCQNWQSPPPIHTPPRVTFAQEFENTSKNFSLKDRGKMAKINALYQCYKYNDSDCVEQVELDSLAFELAPSTYINNNQPSPTFPNIFSGNITQPSRKSFRTIPPKYKHNQVLREGDSLVRKFDRSNIFNNIFPIKEKFKTKNSSDDCECNQTINYWILGISVIFFILFILCIVIFYIKKK